MSNRPQPKAVTQQAEDLLFILRANGGWMKRSEIAAELGAQRANKWTIALLDMLAEKGQIEADKRADDSTPIGFTWFYRATTK